MEAEGGKRPQGMAQRADGLDVLSRESSSTEPSWVGVGRFAAPRSRSMGNDQLRAVEREAHGPVRIDYQVVVQSVGLIEP